MTTGTVPSTSTGASPDELIDVFRSEHPELADAIEQARRTAEVVEAYDRSREPALRYTVSSGTTTE